MTKLLYETKSHLKNFTAKVISCEEGKKGFEVVLDQTAFFPRGGGQEPDHGFIRYKNDSEKADTISDAACDRVAEQKADTISDAAGDRVTWEKADGFMVTEVTIKDGVVTHICDGAVEVGAEVVGEIDFERRFDFMQQHSGEHIVSGLMHQTFGVDNVGFNLGDEVTTLDFNRVFTDEELKDIEKRANEAVFANLPIEISYPTKDELDAMDYRSKKELKGQIRIVSIPGIDVCACCAPHVDLTGEIVQIKILSSMNFRGGTRMTILCGMRALKYYDSLMDKNGEISVLLSAKPTETAEAVQALFDSREEVKASLVNRTNEYFDVLFEKVKKQCTIAHKIFIDEADTNAVRRLVNRMTEELGGCNAVFTGNDEKGYSFIISSASVDSRSYGEVLKEKFGAKFGGKSEMIQGFVNGSEKELYNVIGEAAQSNEKLNADSEVYILEFPDPFQGGWSVEIKTTLGASYSTVLKRINELKLDEKEKISYDYSIILFDKKVEGRYLPTNKLVYGCYGNGTVKVEKGFEYISEFLKLVPNDYKEIGMSDEEARTIMDKARRVTLVTNAEVK